MSKHAAEPQPISAYDDPAEAEEVQIGYELGFDAEQGVYQVAIAGGGVSLLAHIKPEGFERVEMMLAAFAQNVPTLLEQLIEAMEDEQVAPLEPAGQPATGPAGDEPMPVVVTKLPEEA